MKRFESKENKIHTIVEEYSGFGEFCSVANSRKPNKWAVEHGPAKNEHDPGWRKCDSFEQAQDFLMHGYDEDVKELVGRVKTLQKQGTSARTHRYSDLVGYQPIVPNAILGLPKAMINSKKVPVKNKVVTILYNPSVGSATGKSEVMEFGAKLLSHVINLERHGYRVKIEYVCPIQGSAKKSDRQYVLRIPIKSEANPLNIKRTAFPIAHVGMFRYLAFDWYECLPGSVYMSGYGQTYKYADDNLKKNFTDMLDDNEYMINFYDDLDEIFGKIK